MVGWFGPLKRGVLPADTSPMRGRTISRALVATATPILMLAAPFAHTAAFATYVSNHKCHGHTVTIFGTEGNDHLVGTDGPDVILGRSGDDVVSGLGGDDILCGDNGNDTMIGGDGNDIMFAASGDDTFSGGPGDDTK